MSNTLHDEFLFVYGSLRAGAAHPMHRLLQEHARFVCQAAFAGLLFDLGEYPAVVPDPTGKEKVIGEVFLFEENAPLMNLLDRYEGCTALDLEPHQYRRVKKPVCGESGEVYQAWIYLFNHSTDNLSRITGGDYLNR